MYEHRLLSPLKARDGFWNAPDKEAAYWQDSYSMILVTNVLLERYVQSNPGGSHDTHGLFLRHTNARDVEIYATYFFLTPSTLLLVYGVVLLICLKDLHSTA